ncbi:endonuclease/exonuclease/phosphatase family protein [Natronoarchaeum mannanilyticum]|uniref:Endonuclease/exonuclease/phosphatase family protein n=1 Tax=Natronoarchaeum mannanilyticum TaxID=926360 RepID=A0AAV3T6X4_9EURY
MTPLRLLTYNVRYDTPEDGDRAWAHRRDALADVVRSYDPDVVGFQEPLAHQVADLRERLPDHRIVGRGRAAAPDEGEHVPIGFRSGRFALADRETFWLSETPDEPGSVGWDADLPRIATCVRLRDEPADTALVHCNVHLDHRGERARLESATLLRRRLESFADGDPVILSGDFNCEADAPPIRRLVDADAPGLRFRDARTVASKPIEGPGTTRNDYDSLLAGMEIDHVLVTPGVGVERVATCADRDEDGRFPSDHLPVLAELTPPE